MTPSNATSSNALKAPISHSANQSNEVIKEKTEDHLNHQRSRRIDDENDISVQSAARSDTSESPMDGDNLSPKNEDNNERVGNQNSPSPSSSGTAVGKSADELLAEALRENTRLKEKLKFLEEAGKNTSNESDKHIPNDSGIRKFLRDKLPSFSKGNRTRDEDYEKINSVETSPTDFTHKTLSSGQGATNDGMVDEEKCKLHDTSTFDTSQESDSECISLKVTDLTNDHRDETDSGQGDKEESKGGILGDGSFGEVLCDRGSWLVGLLIMQSCSGFILERNEELLQEHIVIVHFLTMLVGAGGNAGNQSCVRVIRGLAVGNLNDSNIVAYLFHELKMAVMLSFILAITGAIRAAVFLVPLGEMIAITSTLWMIVITSIIIGTLLPLFMKFVGIDPAHSCTTIQVMMDIIGVLLTVHVSSAVLSTQFGIAHSTPSLKHDDIDCSEGNSALRMLLRHIV